MLTGGKDCQQMLAEVGRLAEAVTCLAENMKQIYRHQRATETVAIFLDNSNFFGSVGRVGNAFRVDYLKLYDLLVRGRFAMNASCYYDDGETDTPEIRQRRESFRALMHRAGFGLVRFSQKHVAACTREAVTKFIIQDMLNLARDCPRCQTAILIAGDGVYAETVREMMRRHGLKVEVAFFGSATASDLRNAAHQFTDLESVLDGIRLGRAAE